MSDGEDDFPFDIDKALDEIERAHQNPPAFAPEDPNDASDSADPNFSSFFDNSPADGSGGDLASALFGDEDVSGVVLLHLEIRSVRTPCLAMRPAPRRRMTLDR